MAHAHKQRCKKNRHIDINDNDKLLLVTECLSSIRSNPHEHTQLPTILFISPLILKSSHILPAATVHCSLHDAQAGDCGVPEEIQRQEETQGETSGDLLRFYFSRTVSPAIFLSPTLSLSSSLKTSKGNLGMMTCSLKPSSCPFAVLLF